MPVPANAIVTKRTLSRPWPTSDEPIVRLQRKRPPVATFMRERTYERSARREVGKRARRRRSVSCPGLGSVGLLVLEPEVGGRKAQRDLDRAHGENVAGSRGGSPARRAELVDLGEHVLEQVGEREEDVPRIEHAPADLGR